MNRYKPVFQEIFIYLAVSLIVFAILALTIGNHVRLAAALPY